MTKHETNALKTPNAMPRNTRNWTAEQIVSYGQKHYRIDFDDEGRNAKPANKFSAYMQEVMTTFEDPAHWKNPFYARFPQDADGRYCTEWLKAAIIWYHGAKPYITGVGVGTHGYAC